MGDPAEDKLPLTAHLEELRKRLVRSLIAIGVGFGACYYFKDGLFKIITKPLRDVLPKDSYMIYTSLPEAFFTYMKIAFFASLVLTAPFTLYQIWKFISPGLYSREKKYVIPFVLTSTLLFFGGILFAYFLALPPAFGFFVEFSTDSLRPMFTMREYLSFALKFLLAFGVSFQLPVFIFFMTKLGIVNSQLLAKQRRYAILIIFITAAILTPSPDAFTQIIMAIPLMVLYEFSVFIAKFAEKKKKEAESGEQAA
ncbi:MAG: twin-arginine translocase subunit TatC [Deltaproteobacteria bacterium HGW-Deltaproteobacteria-11]|nr:MAG: twin-arginine translocase subunit TatC [Deltaproteobacteria bacterium HGW-Deltaproteobacteria-11]